MCTMYNASVTTIQRRVFSLNTHQGVLVSLQGEYGWLLLVDFGVKPLLHFPQILVVRDLDVLDLTTQLLSEHLLLGQLWYARVCQ